MYSILSLSTSMILRTSGFKFFLSKLSTITSKVFNFEYFPYKIEDKMNDLLHLIYSIDPNMEVAISTNGYNLKSFLEMEDVNKLESIHISRHHYDDEVNYSIFGSKDVASTEDIIALQDGLDDKRIVNINTLVMKDYIEERVLELAHYNLHWLLDTQFLGHLAHERCHGVAVIELLTEHHMPYIVEIYDPHKALCSIEYREYVAFCLCHDRCKGTQIHFGSDWKEVLLNHIGHLQCCKHGLILVVSDEFTTLCKTHCVDIIAVKKPHSEER